MRFRRKHDEKQIPIAKDEVVWADREEGEIVENDGDDGEKEEEENDELSKEDIESAFRFSDLKPRKKTKHAVDQCLVNEGGHEGGSMFAEKYGSPQQSQNGSARIIMEEKNLGGEQKEKVEINEPSFTEHPNEPTENIENLKNFALLHQDFFFSPIRQMESDDKPAAMAAESQDAPKAVEEQQETIEDLHKFVENNFHLFYLPNGDFAP